MRLDLHVTLREHLNPQSLLQIVVTCTEERALNDCRIHGVEWGPYG